MSLQIPTAFVEQYKSNVQLLSQQMGSRLRMGVRVESINGESAFFEQVDQTAAQMKTSRHQDTPQIDTPHRRRMCTLADYVWADYIDKEDKIRLLIEPTGPYTRNAVSAFGRSMDDVLIESALGVAYTGKKGTTAVALPSTQKIVNGGTGLTIDKLIEARAKFWSNDVDESIPLYMAVGNVQLQNLLGTTQITSADYNTVRALVRGEIDTFMGFKFVRIERLPVVSSIRSCIAWAHDGVLLGLGADIHTRVSERDDKNYLTQVWCGMSIGGTRMEEKKVVQIDCDETA